MFKKAKFLILILVFLTSCMNAERQTTYNIKDIDFDLNETKQMKNEKVFNEVENVQEKVSEIQNKKKEIPEILRNSNISFYAVDLDTGKVIENYRGENIVTPASVLKVITSATAMTLFDENKQIETKLYYSGNLKNGVLTGNIYIEGGGDPTLGSSNFKGDREKFIKDWIAAIKKKNIKKIKGNIFVIDHIFGYEGVSGKWLLEDLATGYGQGAYGISVFDNICNLYLSSNSKGATVVKVSPEVPNLKFENKLKISKEGKNNIIVRGLPFDNKKVLMGEVPANRKSIFVRTDIPDPGVFLGEYFKNKLKENKVSVTGKVQTSRTVKYTLRNAHLLYTTKSKPMKDMVKVLLRKSDNHYAEHLYNLIKLEDIDIKNYWKNLGIDTSNLKIYDGSGLSRADYLSSKTLTDILVYMNKNYPNFIELLPVAGKEGTVKNFMRNNVFTGVANIKSGSMSGIQSYSGYLQKDGRKIAFTIMINGWNGSRNQIKREIEKVLNNLFVE